MENQKGIICYDGSCFSIHSKEEIEKHILSNKGKPINPHTDKPFPKDFIQKMKKRYSPSSYSNFGGILNNLDDVPRPDILNFMKKDYDLMEDISPKPVNEGSDIEDIDENSDRYSEESDESSEEEEESETEEEDVVVVKVNMGPNTLGGLNKYLIEGNVTVIFFYTYWCKFCKILNKPYENLISEKIPKVTFLKVNNDYAGEIIDEYDIKVVPSFLVLKRINEKIEVIDVLTGSRIKDLRNIIDKNI